MKGTVTPLEFQLAWQLAWQSVNVNHDSDEQASLWLSIVTA